MTSLKDNTLLQRLYLEPHLLYRLDNRLIGKSFRLHRQDLVRVVRIHLPGNDALCFIKPRSYPGDTSTAIDIRPEL
jgi:hypothetical protein